MDVHLPAKSESPLVCVYKYSHTETGTVTTLEQEFREKNINLKAKRPRKMHTPATKQFKKPMMYNISNFIVCYL